MEHKVYRAVFEVDIDFGRPSEVMAYANKIAEKELTDGLRGFFEGSQKRPMDEKALVTAE